MPGARRLDPSYSNVINVILASVRGAEKVGGVGLGYLRSAGS
jgi:hypothetical protein